MILTGYIYIRNKNGVGIPNRVVTVYPAGTTNNGVQAIDLGKGTYRIELNSATNPNSVSKLYDVYVDNVAKYTNVNFGDWVWVIEGVETDVDVSLLYKDLRTRTFDAVPENMPANVMVSLERCWTDRLGAIDNVTTTGFDLKPSMAGMSPGKYDLRVYLV